MESHGDKKVRWIHILYKGEDTTRSIDDDHIEQQQLPVSAVNNSHDGSNPISCATVAQSTTTFSSPYSPATPYDDDAVGGDHDVQLPSSEDEDEYLAEFRRRGMDAIRVPVLRFEYRKLDKLAELIKELKDDRAGKNSNGLIITSPRVVEAIEKSVLKLARGKENLQKFNPHLVFVIGEKTARDCRTKLGLDYNLDSVKTGNANALREFILLVVNAHVAPQLIYPKSDKADSALCSALAQNRRIRVTPIVVYETKPAPIVEPSKHGLGRVRVLDPHTRLIINMIFFSPSGVDATGDSRTRANILTDVCNQFPHLRDIVFRYSAIGETTRAALIARRSDIFCVAHEPNARAFVDDIEWKMHEYNKQIALEGYY